MPNLRKMKFKVRRKRAPRPVQPSAIQVEYYQNLKKVLGYAHALVKDRLLSKLPEFLDRAAEHRGDGLPGIPELRDLRNVVEERFDAQPPGRRVNKIMEGIARSFYKTYDTERLQKIGERIGEATSTHQRAQLLRQVKSLIGLDLGAIADRKIAPRIKQFAADNVALIKSVPSTYFADVERVVLTGMRDGTRHEEVAAELEERLGVATSKAKLIARDQVLSFQADLNEARQRELGVDSYVWSTAGDTRVREAHAERDGQVFQWDNPPGDESDPGDGANPGDGILCRCYADPVLDNLVEGDDGE